MLDNAASLWPFAPELVVSATAVAVLLLDLGLLRSRRGGAVVCGLALAGLASAAWLTGVVAPPERTVLFHGLFVLDAWTTWFRWIAWAATGLCVVMVAPSTEVGRSRLGAYLSVLLCVAVGLTVMVGSGDLLTVALGLELVSLGSYALVGFRKGERSSAEAALKYVVSGGVATGLMLFGMSWLFGMLGTTSLLHVPEQLAAFLARSGGAPVLFGLDAARLALVVAVVLVLSGLGFKVAAVPWHMWCPDVYEGAPTPFTAFLSVAPKAAAFALAFRLVHLLAPTVPALLPTVGVLAAVTMAVGNAAALAQTNLKRLLAYSSIAHAGYLLVALVVADQSAAGSLALYLVLYVFMNLGAFLAVNVVSRHAKSEVLYDFKGLSSRAPFTAIALAIFLFSLTGLPPLAGFVGKFFLFKVLVDTGTPWHALLALWGLCNSVLSLYYYAKVVRAMFLDEPAVEGRLQVPGAWSFLLGLFVVATLVFGVWFEDLRRLAWASAQAF